MSNFNELTRIEGRAARAEAFADAPTAVVECPHDNDDRAANERHILTMADTLLADLMASPMPLAKLHPREIPIIGIRDRVFGD